MLDFVLQEILRELQEMNGKLDDIRDELADIRQSGAGGVCEKLDEIKGEGFHNSLSDVCNKLDEIGNSIGGLRP